MTSIGFSISPSFCLSTSPLAVMPASPRFSRLHPPRFISCFSAPPAALRFHDQPCRCGQQTLNHPLHRDQRNKLPSTSTHARSSRQPTDGCPPSIPGRTDHSRFESGAYHNGHHRCNNDHGLFHAKYTRKCLESHDVGNLGKMGNLPWAIKADSSGRASRRSARR